MKLTREMLEKYFSYDAETGALTWASVVKGSKAIPGESAGRIDREGYVIVGLRRASLRAHRIIWVLVTGS